MNFSTLLFLILPKSETSVANFFIENNEHSMSDFIESRREAIDYQKRLVDYLQRLPGMPDWVISASQFPIGRK